jgi:hypothetical protein
MWSHTLAYEASDTPVYGMSDARTWSDTLLYGVIP